MKMTNLFNRKKGDATVHSLPILQELVSITKNGSVDRAIQLLATTGKSNNLVSIPYTPEAIRTDFESVRQCMLSENLNDNELAALLAVAMMKKHPKSVSQLLLENGYSQTSMERIIYLGTYTSTLQSLAEFTSSGIKRYKISSCGDSKVCAKCKQHDGKKHLVNKAIIGKNAPPFCERCRCIITAEF